MSILIRLSLAVAGCLLLIGSIRAEVFESYNGRFYIEYPENWTQIDYVTAQFYIQQSAGTAEFEAVFATAEANPWFTGPYLIVTVDTVGELSEDELEEVLENMEASFERARVDRTIEEFMNSPQPEIIAFDQEARTTLTISEVGDTSGVVRISLLAARYYRHGVANFFFYAPESLFAAALPAFKQAITSFTVGAPPTEAAQPVKVADIESRQNNGGTSRTALFVGLGAVLLVLIILFVKRK